MLHNIHKLKSFWLSIILICFTIPVFSQFVATVPVVDLDVANGDSIAYCQPGVKNKSRSKGVEVLYGYRGSGQLRNSKAEPNDLKNKYSKWDNLQIKLKVPIIIKENFKVLIGYKYYQEGFDFTEVGQAHEREILDLNENNLRSSSFSIVLNKSLNDRSYLALQLRYMMSGNFEGLTRFGDRYATYRVLALYGVKPSEDLEYGFAVNFSKNFRKFNVIPFFLFYKNYSPKWGLEGLLPGFIYLRHNISPANILLGGLQFSNKNFRLEIPQEGQEGLDYAYNQSHLRASIKYQQRIVPWIWMSAEVGYQYNLNTNFDAKSANTSSFVLEARDAAYFKVGIFASPHSKEDRLLMSTK